MFKTFYMKIRFYLEPDEAKQLTFILHDIILDYGKKMFALGFFFALLIILLLIGCL